MWWVYDTKKKWQKIHFHSSQHLRLTFVQIHKCYALKGMFTKFQKLRWSKTKPVKRLEWVKNCFTTILHSCNIFWVFRQFASSEKTRSMSVGRTLQYYHGKNNRRTKGIVLNQVEIKEKEGENVSNFRAQIVWKEKYRQKFFTANIFFVSVNVIIKTSNKDCHIKKEQRTIGYS